VKKSVSEVQEKAEAQIVKSEELIKEIEKKEEENERKRKKIDALLLEADAFKND
jgi:hypothetical protein